MILIALGANLPSEHGTPAETIQAAYVALEKCNVSIVTRSRIWLTAPVPFDPTQDWYHNAVVHVDIDLSPDDLLQTMLDIEEDFGRIRTIKNAPRVLDLDLIAYNQELIKEGERLIVPHPRMQERLFVLRPLQDIDTNWVHPSSRRCVSEMIESCDDFQQAKPMEGDDV